MDRNGDPAPGIVTTHDEFAISFSRQEQIDKVEALLATRTEAEAREHFTLCSQNQWVYSDAKRALRTGDWRKELVPILYRPFDLRWTVYSRYVAVHRRERMSKHLLSAGNVGIVTSRQRSQQTGNWAQAFATSTLIESCAISNKTKEINYAFPLWLEPDWPEARQLPNLSPAALRRVSEASGLSALDRSLGLSAKEANGVWNGRGDLKATLGPRDLFDFIYAIVHSESYRERYADFLKGEFARIPLTPARDLFRELARLGAVLVALHLMESPTLDDFITTYTGPKNPEVGRVGWSDGTVWLDAAATKKGQSATPGTIGFRGVPEAVWNFHIGGYQVCEKWLKDRKGRRLSKDDIAHYQKIVVALAETIRLMKEIDEVIERHGGWPGAFQTGEAGDMTPGSLLKVAERRSEYGTGAKGKKNR
jgi:predicted helicase